MKNWVSDRLDSAKWSLVAAEEWLSGAYAELSFPACVDRSYQRAAVAEAKKAVKVAQRKLQEAIDAGTEQSQETPSKEDSEQPE